MYLQQPYLFKEATTITGRVSVGPSLILGRILIVKKTVTYGELITQKFFSHLIQTQFLQCLILLVTAEFEVGITENSGVHVRE